MTKIYHNIYTENMTTVQTVFTDYILKKFKKFKEKYGIKYLLYSLGFANDLYLGSISCISIPHPLDDFNPDIAADIINGRIKRMKGNIRGRLPYNIDKDGNKLQLPEYIHIEYDTN